VLPDEVIAKGPLALAVFKQFAQEIALTLLDKGELKVKVLSLLLKVVQSVEER
jgi:hypothetical protein